ncbi:MAG: hypothetical protein F6K10_32570 [Moorea sp. SIO2B7]|nr:hypothetical protein [Moorena sp. SIO2B7]
MSKQVNRFNHLTSLRVPQVDTSLNGAWLVDLGQGNFAAAKIAAERALSAHQDANTMFARGVIHRLQGEYAEAFPLFEAAFEATSDHNRQFIIASTAYLAEHQRQKISPDGFSLDFEADIQNWHTSTLDSQWRKLWQDLKQQVNTPEVELLGSFLEISTILPALRTLISGISDEQKRNEIIGEIEEQLGKQIQLSQDLAVEKIPEALYVSLAELFAISGKSEHAHALLDRLAQVYQESGNILGLARIKLCQGDITVSPAPQGSPILFGYNLNHHVTHTDITTTQLLKGSIINQPQAHEFYFGARQDFAEVGAIRGEAMAILRLAYLDAIASKWNLASLNLPSPWARHAVRNGIADGNGKLIGCGHIP